MRLLRRGGCGVNRDWYGRLWPNVPDNERCETCGQPDNSGDCEHGMLTHAEVAQLGGVRLGTVRAANVMLLACLPSYTKVVVVDGYTDKPHTYLTRDLPQRNGIYADGRRLTNLNLGTEFFVKHDTPITSVEIIELESRG